MTRDEYSLALVDQLWAYADLIRTIDDPDDVRRHMLTHWTQAERLDALVLAVGAINPRQEPGLLYAWTNRLLRRRNTCAACGAVFTPSRGNGHYRYCSHACSREIRRSKDRARRTNRDLVVVSDGPGVLDPRHRNLVDRAVMHGINPVARLQGLGIDDTAALAYAEQRSAA